MIAAFLSFVARFAEAAEVIVLLDRLVYAQKEYAASPALLVFQGEAAADVVYPGPCAGAPNANLPNYGFTCAPSSGDFIFRDQVKGIVTGVWASSDPGFGWYTSGGVWQWSSYKNLKLRPEAQLECGIRACWWYVSRDFAPPEKKYVVYVGGGLQYRFEWARVSLTPFVGVVGHWPRIESVSGTNHLFQLGLRGGLKLSEQSELLLQYSHFSNGNRLKLADETLSNQGIEALSLGLGWKF